MKTTFLLFCALVFGAAASRADVLRGVVSLPDGKPAAGAEVVLLDGTGGDDQPVVSALSGPDGAFAIESKRDFAGETPENRSEVAAHLPGYGVAWSQIIYPKQSFALRLAPPGTHVLRARDEAGKPIAGFEAALFFVQRPSLPWDVWDLLLLPKPLAQRWALHATNGEVRVSDVPDRFEARWRVTAPGFAPQSVLNTGGATRTVTLQRAATVRGKVIGADPLPSGLKISVTVPTKTDPTGWITEWGESFPVAPDGTFSFVMPPGKARLSVVSDWLSATQFAGETSFVVKGGDAREITLPLRPVKTRPVAARVVDDSGAPVPGVRFVLQEAFQRLPPTGADGTAQFFAPPGKIDIPSDPPPSGYLRPAEDPQMDRQFTIPDGDGPFQLPDLVMPRAARMQVRVVGPDGQPLPGVVVEAGQDAAMVYGPDTLPTDADGIAHFARLDGKKPQFVRAHTAQGFSETLAVALPLPESVTLTFQPSFTRLAGRLLDDAGQPLAERRFTVLARDISAKQDNEPSIDFQLSTGADGRFFSPLLPPRMSYRLSVAPPNFAPVRTEWRPATGAQTAFGDMVLQRLNGALRGTVRDARGKAAKGAQVWCIGAEHLNAARQAVSDARGAFTLSNLPKRALLVFAQAANGESAAAFARPGAALRLRLGRYGSERKVTSRQARRALAWRLLEATIREVQRQKSGAGRLNNLAYLAAQVARRDAKRARQLIGDSAEVRDYLLGEQFTQALESEPPDVPRALDCWNALTPADWRTYRLTNGAHRLSFHHPGAARLLLPTALRAARATKEIPARTGQFTTLLGVMARLGDSGVPSLRDEILALIAQQPDGTQARLNLAENLAIYDADAALTLIEPLKKSVERARVVRKIARQLAPRDAERAIRLVREALVENDPQGYPEEHDEALALLCPAIAKTNLPRAVALARSLPAGYLRALAHWLLAQRLAPKDKVAARAQLQAAIAQAFAVKPVALDTSIGWRDRNDGGLIRGPESENLDSLRFLLARAAQRWKLSSAPNLALRALAANAVGTFTVGGSDYSIQQDAAATLAAAQLAPGYARDWVSIYWPRANERTAKTGTWTISNMMSAAAFGDLKLCERIWREMPAGLRPLCTVEFTKLMLKDDVAFERDIRAHLHVSFSADD